MKRCTKCGKRKLKSRFSRANRSKDGLRFWCKSCDIKFGKKWYTENRERKREAGKRYWGQHKDRLNKIQRELYRTLRLDLIKAYGNKCSCCGEHRKEFLTLEHIRGDGAKHRRKMSNYSIFVQIKREKYPKDKYTILCSNCNFALAYSGYCPHKGE